jgi:preprotein translocase subunit SecG
MITIVLSIVMLALLVVCGLMGIIILMQKPSANAGMGAALGGGAAESVFGGEAGNQLLKYTIRMAVAFFVVSFLLYLGVLAQHRAQLSSGGQLPKMTAQPGDAPAASPVTSGKLPTATGAANAASTTTLPATPAASAPAASGAAMAPASLPALAPIPATPAPAASSASASSN